MKSKNNLEIKPGQTLVIEREEIKQDGRRGRRTKIYQRWTVKEIYEYIIVCERKVNKRAIRESFTWFDLNEKLITIE